MKALYQLFGLMILCAAGTGAINSSLGYLDDQNLNQSTPFLIFGHVWYANSSPCNNSIVNITNLNTGAEWCADAVSGCNYYQTLLCAANVSVNDVLQWSTADGAVFNTTNRTVGQSDLDSGGIFDFDIILQLAPKIIGCAPESLMIHDVENAERRFNITIDQVVDVIWLINGLQAQTNGSVTDASYTNTSAVIGCWNVSAVANNTNGTVMQTWNWTVTAVLPPEITSYNPNTTVSDIKGATRIFNITVDQVVDVTWLINGLPTQTNESVTDASYTHTNVAIGVWNISANASNENGTAMQEWVWNVTMLLPPNITAFAPPSPVRDTENATRTFGITIDQVVDVTWLINGTEVSDEADVNESSYTNTSAAIGVCNVTAVASNQNGTDAQEWTWHVTSHTPTPSSVFVIYGNVSYDNGSACNSPFVVVTNLNTSEELVADNRTGEGFYQLVTSSAFAEAGDVLRINASKNGIPVGNATHTVNRTDIIEQGVIEVDINLALVSTAPRITGYAPESPVHDIENTTRTFNITVDQVVNVTWLINGSQAQTNGSVTDASYTNTSASIGVWNVSAIASNGNGTDMQEWIWNVTTLPPPKITAFAPPSPVHDTENATRTFSITVDQVVDVTWLINGTKVFNKADVNESSYTNTSASIGVWNVTAVVSNQNGTDIREWTWHVTSHAPALSPVFVIYGNVSYDNGSACNSPFVVVTNLNTSEELIADNRTGEGFYQLVTSSAFAEAGDVLRINASKNGIPVGNATHTVNLTDMEQGAIEVDINERYLPDFTITNLIDLPDQLMIGDIVTINATIANHGAAEGAVFVEFCDNKSITIERVLNDYPESPINDTIRLPDVKRIRVHFKSFDVSSWGNITIYNETRLVERLNGTGRDHWTEWCDGGTIRIESWNARFMVDRYEAVFADQNISLGAGNSTNISAVWNLSDQSMGWAVHGSHNITVRVDPYNEVIEYDEMNNERIEAVYANPSLDFAVTEMSLNTTEPVLGDVVGITANISNYGVRNGTTVVGVYYDNRSIEIVREIHRTKKQLEGENYVSTDNISLPSGVLGARLHFNSLNALNGHVDICDNKGRVVERIEVNKNNHWTDCIYTDNITVRAVLLYDPSQGTYECNYIIDRYEALIAEEPVTLNATESKAIDASWLTGAAYGGAREHDITVMVDPRNHSVETNETNNTGSKGIIVNGTDLTVTEIEIPCGSSDNPCYVGQDVEVTTTIANIGAVDATNFTVEFRDGTCVYCSDMNTSGVIFNETHIDRLNSGDNMTISVIWNPAEINNHTITARIPYDDTDSNETNNELSDCSDVEARYDFSVEGVNVDPQTAEKGESVNITASVGCTGHGGGNVSITFFVNSTDFAGTFGERFTRIGTIDDVHLEVNETETVSMRWDVDVVGGYHLIVAVVNPENELEEVGGTGTKYIYDTIRFRGSDIGNNVKNCTLHVIPLDLDITDLTLAPSEPNSGDIVDVTAEIRNNGDMEANSTVWFYMERNESIAERSSYAGSWQWQTALQPEVPMRFHFDYIEIFNYAPTAGGVNAYVTDRRSQKPVYFYVKCGENYGGQYAKTHRISLSPISGEDVGSWKRWNDVWTDWINGTAFELDAGHNVRLAIDKYQIQLGNRTVTLSAGESGFYNAEWNTSPPLKPGKNYTILANVENQKKESNVTRLGGTDLTITNLTIKDLSVKPVVWDGEAVWVNATIENLGRMNATAFNVEFTEIYHPEEVSDTRTGYGHLETITETRIEGLDSGNSTNISVLWNASIREIECEGKCGRKDCNWIEIADDYTIRVKIDLLENLDLEEDSNTNHSLQQYVHVNPSRDFNVTNLSFSVNDAARDPPEFNLYDDVILNATVNITNLVDAGSVDVCFYIDEVSDEHKIGNCSITFDAGDGTEYAEIEWSVTCPPGYHDVIVVADPAREIQEINETNNNLTQKIFVNAPELVLESLDVYPMNPMRGETVSINVTIANVGEKNVSDVTLCIYDWAERQIENLDEQSGPVREQIEITRENATAMKLYLDLEVGVGCKVCINDGSGSRVICYHKNFHGWTPWMFDNSTTIVVTNTETKIASARVSKVYYIAPSSIIDTSVHYLGINETKNITVNWNTSVVGERFIAAIVDPKDNVTEYNESNNRLAEFISVQTADLIVSNLSLWLNGTEIGEDDIIKHGDNVTITTDIANIGIEDAGNFSVRFLIDGIPIEEEVIQDLANGSTRRLVTNWSATVGYHLIKVEVDWENTIDETNETNNILAWERCISGAELLGNISWETLGLHGNILFESTQPYDEDEVVVTAAINNSGSIRATNFSAALFFDYTPFGFQKRVRHTNSTGEWINKTYPDAEYLYLNITTPVYVTDGRCMIKDDVIIYDGNGSEVARPYKSCSVLVNGNTTNVFITPQGYSSEPVFDIYFYPIYQNGTSMLFDGINVPVNSSHNISMNMTANVGDFTIMAVIDPGNKVPEDEDHRADNILSRMMSVKPTRDFTVTDVTAACTNLSDIDTTEITAEVSNIGLRNGTADVSFVDCEVESRTYKYHFDANRSLSYLPIPPNAMLSGFQYDASPIPDIYHAFKNYENLMIIHRPGVDAIELHFDRIILSRPSLDGRIGVISVRDENETEVWIRTYRSGNSANVDIRVPGETAYIYTCKASFDLDGYTTEKELLKEEVRLNSTKDTNESKYITSMWTASTGDHTIGVTLDGDDKITEISELNNRLSPLFHVNASRDPAIIELNITPEHPEDGNDVAISAIITNNGSKNASFTFDLWANTTRNKDGADESLPDPKLITDLGDRIRYITLLKHADITTLAPGKNVTVNATWSDISVFGSPTHHIIAIVDPLDEIDEMNESNNEIEKEIIMAYSDLTIGRSYVLGGKEKVVVNIEEIGGISGASDVTVRFESYETVEYNRGRDCIHHPGATNMQVYFDHIDARDGYVEVGGKRYSGGEFSDVWSPWVEGDIICIKCRGGATWFDISKYRWGNVSDEQIDDLPKGKTKYVKMPWGYEYPRNVDVTVDPDNNITELDEDNNNKMVLMYADLRADKISFVSPSSDKLSLDAEKFKIDGTITNEGDEVGAIFPVGDFNVTLEFRNRYPNGTVGDLVFNMTKHIEDPLCAGKEMPIRFEFDPSEELEVGGNYTVFLIADSSGDVCESNELYPDGEDNNATSVDIYVYNTSGYTGGGELINVAQGEVHGRVVYTVGDKPSCRYEGLTDPGGEKTVRYTGVVPDDADDIEFARIFVYWYMYHPDPNRPGCFIPEIADVDVTFNGRSLSRKAGNYTDTPGAADKDYGYGLYSYDVTNYVTKGENIATMRNNAEWMMGVHAIGLLVIYEDEDEPLTKYWINEGADIMMPENPSYQTGLPPSTATARFVDVEENDTENVDATLLTVLGFYKKYGETRSDVLDALEFNNRSIGSLICDGVECGYWEYHYSKTGLGLTKNEWEDVTDHLKREDNLAEIHSLGNYMMPNNAFLRLIFPPDLAVTDIEAPVSAVIGNKYVINATISNEGRSDATDFNVSFYSNNVRVERHPISRLDSGDNITLQFNWKPMYMGKIYQLKVVADVVSGPDWVEPDVDNNVMTKNVPIVASGFGNESGPMGEGGAGAGGSGDGEGVSLFDTITGILMKGSILKDGGGGGGGIGEFSLLEWIMKGLVLTTCSFLVYFGYSMEKRRHNRR